MMKGHIDQELQALVTLNVLHQGTMQAVEFVVDTGFSGFVAVPQSLVDRLGLPVVDVQRGMTADGRVGYFDLVDVAILWHDRRTVFRAQILDEPLIGTRLLRGHEWRVLWQAGETFELVQKNNINTTPATNLNFVAIYSRDIEVSKEFYDRLGLRFQPEQHGNGPRHFAATLASTVFEIYPCGDELDHGRVRIGFQVPSVDRVIDDLRPHGSRIIAEPKSSPWGRRAVVEDPDGYRVELMEPVAV